MRMKPWNEHDASAHWFFQRHIGRVQLGLHVYRHHGHLPDRWVFHPSLVVDRKHHVTPIEKRNPVEAP